MTVSSSINRVSYNGNSATTAFSFPYLFYADADLTVIAVSSTGVETVKTITTHYTVTGADNPAGGTVTMLVAPATGTKLVILREVDAVQDLDLVDNDPLLAASLEEQLDRNVMMAQQLQEINDRSLRFPRGDSSALTSELPASVTRASKALIFDASGNITVSTDDFEDQATDAAASAAAAAASASAASTSASTASTQASNASTSATNASNSAAAAAASAAALPNAAAIGAGKVPQSDGALWAGITVTAAGAAILDDADAAAQRTTLGLVIGTDVQAYSANIVQKNASNAYTAEQHFTEATLTDGATVNWDVSAAQVAKLTLGGNRTMAAPTNLANGLFVSVTVIQDGTGSRTLAWNSVFKFVGGTAPTLTTTASAKDILTFRSDGTNLYEVGRALDVK